MKSKESKSEEKKLMPDISSLYEPPAKVSTSFQLKDNRPLSILQKKQMEVAPGRHTLAPDQIKENKTGLPDQLKSGIENLSGYSLDDVSVHYNSSKPAGVSAHAYAQGNEIHIASGQEKYLPHEAWHVVQQKQGRVKPTKQLKAVFNINDDPALEKEADKMGNKALQNIHPVHSTPALPGYPFSLSPHFMQRYVIVKDPERRYDNLSRLVNLTRNAIMSVVSEHRDEPFYRRVENDLEFFHQIVEELFDSDPVYDKLKDFTDEIIQTGVAKADLNPEKYNRDEWALLHRMESQSFKKFIEAKEGHEHDESIKHVYEATSSKYNPGPKHTWKGNTGWLDYVINRFSKLVVTDIPMAVENVFRQKINTTGIGAPGERDFRIFSAYAREIAALLYEGYVPITQKTIGAAYKTPVTAITMIKLALLPPTVQAAVVKRVKVDRNAAKWIAKGISLNDVGHGLPTEEMIHTALSFFQNAGIPAKLGGRPAPVGAHQDPYRPMSWASRDFHPAEEGREEKLRMEREKIEARKQEKAEKAQSSAYVSPADSILDREGLIRFIREVYHDVENPKKTYNNPDKITRILEEGPGRGLITGEMTKNKLREFLKNNRKAIWPD